MDMATAARQRTLASLKAMQFGAAATLAPPPALSPGPNTAITKAGVLARVFVAAENQLLADMYSRMVKKNSSIEIVGRDCATLRPPSACGQQREYFIADLARRLSGRCRRDSQCAFLRSGSGDRDARRNRRRTGVPAMRARRRARIPVPRGALRGDRARHSGGARRRGRLPGNALRPPLPLF